MASLVNFCSAKDTIKRMKRQGTDGEDISANDPITSIQNIKRILKIQ